MFCLFLLSSFFYRLTGSGCVIVAKLIGTDGTKHEEEGLRVTLERSYCKTTLLLTSLLRPWLLAGADGWNSSLWPLGTKIEACLSLRSY